jgi:hypothetical protein
MELITQYSSLITHHYSSETVSNRNDPAKSFIQITRVFTAYRQSNDMK